MGSVDRSRHKRGLHNIPSRLTTDSTGRSRAAIEAGEMKGGRWPRQQTAGTTLWLTGTASPNASRRGRDDSAWNLEKSAGHDQLAARSARQTTGTGQDRSQCARLRKGDEGLASHPNRRRRGARAENTGRVHECPLPRWMISTRTVPAGLSMSKGRTGGLKSRSGLRTGQIEPLILDRIVTTTVLSLVA
jgi:hypothetical protein